MYVYIVLPIVFNYGAGHTVDEVSESDYKSCTLGNSISSDSSEAQAYLSRQLILTTSFALSPATVPAA